MDTVDQKTRSRIMSSVGQKNTGPEMKLRSALHKFGLRYRLHDGLLPGSPDIVFPKYDAVLFVHGCYWHAHGCYRSTIPKTRSEFWSAKFDANRRRDSQKVDALRKQGWRVLTVWECALTGKASLPTELVSKKVKDWLESENSIGQISGRALSI